MPLSPEEAVVLTPENLAEVDSVCVAVDGWLRRNAVTTDFTVTVPIEGRHMRKVLAEVCTRYRQAGWIGAWTENGSLHLWAVRRPPN